MTTDPLGVFDLDPVVQVDPGPPLKIKCFVRDCGEYLFPPSRDYRGTLCRYHHIRAHQSATYSYVDVRRNAIVSPDFLATKIVGHPSKFESHRLGSEKSEDTLTYNVFRSFQEASCLNYIGRFITGLDDEREPTLFLWGIEMTNDSLLPWDLLAAARARFEQRLPVKRPLTEPDIGLFLAHKYLILCEAKFTSENTFYADGPRKDNASLTKNELLNIYSDLTLRYVDRNIATEADRVYYQLFRNVAFAEYMASLAEPGTQAYFANLTRRFTENESFQHFASMVHPEFAGRLAHIFWEDLFVLAGLAGGKLSRLQEYMLTKTANLTPAFNFGLY